MSLEHWEILDRGTKAWGEWRAANPTVRPDLTGISIGKDGPHLSGYDLSNALLQGARIGKVHASYCNLRGADCRGSQWSAMSLSDADLTDADFRGALFFNCFLRNADLTRANFAGAAFSNVDFDGATLDGTIFGNDDLRSITNLDRVQHAGPVIIGIRALSASAWRLPPTFLERARVPEEIRAIARTLADRPATHHSCFICYSSEDGEFAERLRDVLVNRHVDAFLAARDLQVGDPWREVVMKKLKSAGKVIVLISQPALTSDEVALEVELALTRHEREGSVIVPVLRISDNEWQNSRDWAARIRASIHALKFYDRPLSDASIDEIVNSLKIVKPQSVAP